MAKAKTGFNGNPFLRNAYEQIEYTDEQLDELEKCKEDPIYFIENYAKIVSLDKGVVPFKMFGYQKEFIETVHTSRKSLVKMGRQLGKCVGKDSKYTIRNNKTGEILEITAEEFHNLTKHDDINNSNAQ